jgi:hypothetical protein
MNKIRQANQSNLKSSKMLNKNNMLGKRLWLDVEQMSLSDRRDTKKSAACSDQDSPTVRQRTSACTRCNKEGLVLSTCMLPGDVRKNSIADQVDRPMDPAYRKYAYRHVLQSNGHAMLPERVSLKNMVQICHAVWNREDDDSSF